MKINSTATCVSLILRSLDQSVAPAVTTPDAVGALGLIRTTLLDLLKRQGPSIEILRQNIKDGEELEQHILNYFDRLAASPAPEHIKTPHVGFDNLAEYHDELTTRLDNEGKRLSALTDKDPRAAVLLRRLAEWEMKYYSEIIPIQVAPFGDEPHIQPPAFDALSQPLTKEFLQEFLISQRGHHLEVISFVPVTGGFGKQTYKCAIRHLDENIYEETGNSGQGHCSIEELIIRKADPAPIMLHSTFCLENEFDLLRSLSKTSFPSPHPIELASKLQGVDGTFYTMDLLPGTIPRPFLDSQEKMEVSEIIILQLAELLAQLHAIPLDNFEDYITKYEDSSALQETVGDRYRRNMRGWREYVERVEHMPSPYATWLFNWLENNIPDDRRRPVLSHGDFAVHNVLVVNERVTGVLDWECADFGAPEQDLAYIKPHVVKHMGWQRFLDHYTASGGQEIHLQIMPFCAAYGVLRTFLGGIMSSQNIQRGRNRDLRYVMMEYGFGPMFMEMGLAATEEGLSS